MGNYDKERAIAAQNAATAAATLLQGRPVNIDDFEEYRTGIFNGTLALAGAESVVERLETNRPQPARRSGGGNSRGPAGDTNNPGSIAFRSGKYEGQTIAEIYDDDPGYIEFCATDDFRNEFMRKMCQNFLAAAA